MKFVGYQTAGITMPQLQAWLLRIMRPPYRCHYSIYLADGTYCGETFYSVNAETGSAAMDIKLLPEARGQGIATRALGFAINQAFQVGQAARVYVDPPGQHQGLELVSSSRLCQSTQAQQFASGSYLSGNHAGSVASQQGGPRGRLETGTTQPRGRSLWLVRDEGKRFGNFEPLSCALGDYMTNCK